MKSWFTNLGWILVGTLLLAAALISAGHREEITNPSSDSFYPSGTSALKQLLINRGYKVRVDRRPHPDLKAGDVALEFYFPVNIEKDSPANQAIANVKEATSNGAITFLLPMSQSFPDALQVSNGGALSEPAPGQPRSITNHSVDGGLTQSGDGTFSRSFYATGAESLVSLDSQGKGFFVDYSSGIGLTNRYIDKANNAQVLLEALAAVAPPNAEVVLPEATFGNVREPGLLASIGPWAESGWYQILFLFGVIVFTLNKRFGLPDEYRPKQRGARELLDAVTDTYVRARACRPALAAATQMADSRLRIALKLPRDASAGERDRLLPETLIRSLATAQAASELKDTREPQAYQMAKKLETDVDQFLREKSQAAPRRGRTRQAARL